MDVNRIKNNASDVDILKRFIECFQNCNDFDKGYILGYAENLAEIRASRKKLEAEEEKVKKEYEKLRKETRK